MMKIFLCMCLLFSSFQCLARQSDKTCFVTSCSVGDKGITYVSKSEPYYACPTRELVDYISTVIGLVSMTIELTGEPPNISDKTGEPEYLDTEDGPNKTRLMLDSLRNKAKVVTFDEAIAMCSEGVGKIQVSVLNSSKDEFTIFVMDKKTKNTFWMPKSNLYKQ